MASENRLADGQLDFSGGVNSGVVPTIASEIAPKGLKRNQLAWLINATVRGGGVGTRTGWKQIASLPRGLYQSGYMYEPLSAYPYLVVSISGHIYRCRVDTDGSVDEIAASLPMPAFEPHGFMVQGEEFLVIQAGDYSTLPLFWDGNIMRRSLGLVPKVGGELPAAGPMDYWMGRIWYASGRQYCAGDIVGSTASGTPGYVYRDSILKITENLAAIAGTDFIVPSNAGNIRALAHAANLDTALGQSPLYVFTRRAIYWNDAPVTRAAWQAATASEPLQKVAQSRGGTFGDRSVVACNGDLFYASADGFRSLASAVRYFHQWGQVPISKNVNRVIKYNDRSLMSAATGMVFDNRLWQGVLPKQTASGIAFQGAVVMDFDDLSSLDERDPPVWEGLYEGLDVLQFFEADYGGLERAFAVVVSRIDGSLQVWEFTLADRFNNGDNRTDWIIEFPALTFGTPLVLKQLDGLELWVDKVYGTVEVDAYWRPDQHPCWQPWHTFKICAARDCTEDVYNDSACYIIQPFREQYRSTIILPVPPNMCESTNGRPLNMGYQFQARLVIRGWMRIRSAIMYAFKKEQPPYAGLNCTNAGDDVAVQFSPVPDPPVIPTRDVSQFGPPPVGACVMPDATCQILTQAQCVAAGGTYQGDGSSCPTAPLGSCCLPDGSCQVSTQAQCTDLGGIWTLGGVCLPNTCFTPDALSDLFAWYDAAIGLYDATVGGSAVTADGASVKRWENQVVGMSHLTQATNPPILKTSIVNSLPVIRFDGIAQILDGTNAPAVNQPATYFLVFKLATSGQPQYAWSTPTATPRFWFGRVLTKWNVYSENGTPIDLTNADTNWNIWAFKLDGAASKYSFNSKTLATVSGSPGSQAGSVQNMRLGALYNSTGFAGMDVAEVLLYHQGVADADMGKVIDYLANKYAITLV